MVASFLKYSFLIPVFPLIAFAVNILFGKHIQKNASFISILASLGSLIFAVPCMFAVTEGHNYLYDWSWLELGSYDLRFGVLLDPLSVTLLFVVTLIGTCIVIYSSGYMQDDPRYSRFFAYVSLFMSGMLTLVIAPNYVQFFMAWEIMGLCSYLLIGFWFEKDSAADAGRKAFLTTRIGDIGFFLGIMTLFVATGTLSFNQLNTVFHHGSHVANAALLPMAALLIFCGTIGKSAQAPLHVWLPDAMEGPTPVSALIHAATMVAAGVYLIARSFALFSGFENVMQIVVIIGTLTAFAAAIVALTQNDIKKVLAYSTISQLGYMVVAMGLGSMAAGMFHLVTHAFFKALLFLGAGSVIHGCHTQDMRQMGGLLKKMPHTAWTFIIASVAIAGVPPLSGFWSKDEILVAAFDGGHSFVFWTLLVTALMTAFYMFRLVFMTFFGKPKDEKIHAHESPASMTLPLWILAIGAILVGIPGSPLLNFWFQGFLYGPHHHAEHHMNLFVVACSILSALGGIALAALLYLSKNSIAASIAEKFKPVYLASQNKFWIDEIYQAVFIRPFVNLAQFLFVFDQNVVDGSVNGSGFITVKLGTVKAWIDKYIVDGIVNLTGYVTQLSSAVFRKIHTGFVQHYLMIIVVGIAVLMFFELK